MLQSIYILAHVRASVRTLSRQCARRTVHVQFHEDSKTRCDRLNSLLKCSILFIYYLFIQYFKRVTYLARRPVYHMALWTYNWYIKHGNKQTVICTYIQACMALLKKDNNAVSGKLKVSHSLTSGGTFVVYIVHPMCSDGYIKIVCS